MEVIEITQENINNFGSIMPEDVIESIGRKFYHAIAVIDNSQEVLGCLVWSYKDVNEESDTEAEIIYISITDEDSGKELFDCFLREAQAESVRRIFVELGSDDEELRAFLTSMGFNITEKESKDIYVNISDLQSIKFLQKRPPSRVYALFDVSAKEFRQGIMKCIYFGKRGLMEDLSSLPKTWYDPAVSCAVKADDEITGVLLIHTFPSGDVMPCLLFADEPDAKMNLLDMLRFSAQSVSYQYSEDTRLLIRRESPTTIGLVKKLFPDKKGENIYFGELRL